MGQFDTLDGVIGVLRRRFALILGVTLMGVVLSYFYATSLPRVYEANAVIQIELPNISDSSTTQTPASQAKYRLNLIEQQLMARDSLEGIISELSLFAGLPITDMEKIDALRKAVVIRQIQKEADLWRADSVPSGLLINVRLGDPEIVAMVANTFLDNILIQSEARRQEKAGDALSFFESEATRVDSKMTALEAEIAAFKQLNADSLPAGVPSLRDQLASLRETELEIERQILGLNSNASRVREDVLAQQLNELEVQNRLVAERIATIQTALAAAPQVEREYNHLTRELEQLKAQWTVITERRAKAEMGLMLESSQQSERFEILEAALPPLYPVAPSRKKVMAAGVALFMVIGVVTAVILELLNPAIRTSAQMEREVGVAPIVAIPTIGKTSHRPPKHRRGIVWLSALLLGLIGVALAFFRDGGGSLFSGLTERRRRARFTNI